MSNNFAEHQTLYLNIKLLSITRNISMLWRIVELACVVTWRLSRRNHQKYKSQMEQWSTGGMTSSNVKTVAKPSHRIVAVLKSLHFALGEFNCKGSLNIAGIREKLDFACALDPMVSKTDILDLFWHFSIKHVVFAEATFFPSWFYRLARQLKHSDITLIDRCQNRSRISVFLPWRPGHTKFNISRTPPMFKESLKLNSHGKVSVSQRKKRELDNRNLMHVITLLNTINIFRPTNAGKPGGNRCRIQSRCYFNWRLNSLQYR